MRVFQLAGLTAGVWLTVAAAHAAPASAALANRLYVKQNGAIVFAVDTGGNVYTRAGERYGVTTADTGVQFRWNHLPFLAIRDASAADRHQQGTFVAGNGFIYENFSQVPFQPSDSLVFFYKANANTAKVGMMEVDHTDGGVDIRGNYDSRFAYRQSARNLKPSERANLVAAWVCTDAHYYPGSQGMPNPVDPNAVGGVSWWDKQNQIHSGFGEHTMSETTTPAFLPWHRDFIARFEQNLRACDPLVSLTYWDWVYGTLEPGADGVPLMTDDLNPSATPGWFGNSWDRVGDPFRSLDSFDDGNVGNDREITNNPADAPATLFRNYRPGALPDDDQLLSIGNFLTFNENLQGVHNQAHSCFGGQVGNLDTAAEDPFFFLIHTNVDRLWATWQRQPDQDWRLLGEDVYDVYSSMWSVNWPLQYPTSTIMEMYMGTNVVDPWAGGVAYSNATGTALAPWNTQAGKIVQQYNDPAITVPTLYEGPNGWDVY